jgi:hypothetical protein
VPGTNWLAIHALNVAHEDPTFLVSPEVEGNFVGYDLNARAWFVQPTPGAPNHAGSTTIGPLIIDVQHAPRVPEDNNPLLLLARVTPTVQPVGKVEARYRVMFLAEQALTLFDDGKHGDGAAGDHLFGNWIPAEVSVSGQMVRYYVNAVDEEGTASRAPAYPDPRDSPQYFGTVVKDPRLADSKLPVLHWFLQNASGADTDSGARGSFFFEGEFYDNVRADLHGQSTRAFPKKSYDLDFNPGYKFRWSADAPRVGDLNLLTTWADKTFFRTILAYETYRKAGVPAHFAFVARVQRNGTFFSVANVVENGGEDFLERVGLDTQGALYSMQNGADSVAMAEKKSRKGEGSQDLQELVTGMGQSTATARQTYLYDNLDIPEIVNFLAARMLTADTDCCHKNYYLYRDSEGTGEWQALPWDVDLSFGRVWTCGNPCLAYFDERIFTNQALLLGMGNRVFTPFYETPALRQMVMRRFRSLMDELFQPPGTPSQTDLLRQRTTELRDLIAPDALLDFAKWGTWGTRETITQAVDRIWTEFLPGRRLYLYQTMSEARGGPVPAQQTADALVRFGSLEYRPASGNPAEEWLMLTNGNTYAVDISAWQLEGGVRFQFKPGTIIPGRATMYVSPDVKAFRSRSLSPKGGERRLVVGPYSGNLSAWGESLVLLDNARRVVSTTNYPGAPSTAQKSLRITEIFYNPDPLPSSPGLDPQLYEFIELRNTGSTALDLRGVRFSAGVEFDFSTGSITNLAPGARVVVAKNAAALALRYGSSIPVAGEYTGNLSNSGETLRLVDAAGEKILEFEYGGKMVPAADGHGFSLVVRDEALPWQQWELSDSWRLNGTRGGTPGTENTAAPVLPGILINEVLAHTDPPQSDAIEIYNPTDSPVDVGGWFLTDEFGEPRKFRIPSPTVLGAGQYVYFSEADFNPTPSSTGSFALRSDGDEAWLFSADPSGALTGYAQGFDFEATANGVSLGRHTNSLGVVDYVPQDELTLGRTNARPLTGPIVLSEIMLVPGTSGADTTLSYIELANITVTNAPLQHPVQLTNAWQVTAPVRFSFPTNVVLAPGGQVLLVGFDPEVQQTTLNAFRLRYGLPTDVLILGPWDGTWNLDEDVSLTRPDAANVSTVPYIPVEHIAYGQWTLPMNALPSSVMSLQRRLPAGYANEPGNWFVARPSPGAHNIEPLPQPPSVAISAPADGFAIATGAALEISIEATDPDNAVQRVEVFSDGQLIATLASAPYVHSWEPAQGAHHLQAVAYDIGGLAATSAVVQIAAAQATRFSATLVPAESIWKYMDDGVNRGSSWTAPGYNDKTWKSGRAEFGYGDAAEGRPEATQLSFGPSATEKYVTYYFRREFLATNTFALSEVTANLLRDDGAIVYLNGLPLFRSNMPEVSSYSQLALSAVSGADEARFFPQQLDRSVIKEGTNVVAVEVHQASRDSSDLSFDFSLTGSGTLLAPVILQHPHPTNAPSGSSVTLQVRAAETGPLEYTWTRDGMVLPGAKGTTLTLVNLAQTQAGVYRALVRNVAGEVWSESALVSVNTPSPQPGLDGLLVEIGVTAHLDASALLANDLDPQGGTLSLTGVDAVSAAGFPISLAQGLITYRSSATFVGPDSFKYSVAGSDGAVAQGRVEILVYSGELPETGKLLILRETDRVLLRFREEPGKRWVLQQSLDLSSWSDQQEAFIPAYGVWEYSVGEPAETARYYRVARK